MDKLILGIDLGTTYSTMAVLNQFGKSTIVPNADGHPTTPSVVHFYEPVGNGCRGGFVDHAQDVQSCQSPSVRTRPIYCWSPRS